MRHVDDILAAVNSSFDLDSFLAFINSLYPTLNFTFEWEVNSAIPFLDVLITRSPSHLKFKVFRKSTHSNNYLHFFSYHPHTVKLSVAQGLFLRALRICSKEFVKDEIKYIFLSLTKLGYPKFFLNKALSKAKHSFFRPRFHSTSSKPTSFVSVPYVPSLDPKSSKHTLPPNYAVSFLVIPIKLGLS